MEKIMPTEYSQQLEIIEGILKNRFLLRRFRQGETSLNRRMIEYELERAGYKKEDLSTVARAESDAEKLLPIEKEEKVEQLPSGLVASDAEAEYGTALTRRAHLLKEKGKLANSLHGFAAADNEGRKKVMSEINTIDEEIAILSNKIAFYENTKVWPVKKEDKAELPENILELVKMRSNIRSNISKIEKAIKEGKNVTANKTKVEKLKNKLNDINEKIEKSSTGGG